MRSQSVLASLLLSMLLVSCGGGRQAHVTTADHAAALYVHDPEAARAALRDLTDHTLARTERASRLFVEGYFMRTLVAAQGVLDSLSGQPLLEPAIAFADTLVATQNAEGYWPIGYDTGWVADMAAALGLFPALEPHVSAARAQRYQTAAERFVHALEKDGLILESGAFGVGWPMKDRDKNVAKAWRSDVGWSDREFLVSTALAGIEVHAWLYRRTSEAKYRDRAVAALDFTLSKLQTDGSLPAFSKAEGALATAAYVQEGWMAADALLEDPQILARLRGALPKHVDWLLRLQWPDGTWPGNVPGEFARTPSIIDFLMWYDQRCEARDDVRQAVRRASQVLIEGKRRTSYGLFAAGENQEVLRAIAGRPLAALARGRYVL